MNYVHTNRVFLTPFIPETNWQDLEDLRVEHLRLVEDLKTKESQRQKLGFSYDEEDRGSSNTYTPASERADLLGEADHHVRQASHALEQFIDNLLSALPEQAKAWLEDLAGEEQNAEEKRAEAERLHHEADLTVHKVKRMKSWIQNVTGGPVHHIVAFESAPVPPAPRRITEDDLARRMSGRLPLEAEQRIAAADEKRSEAARQRNQQRSTYV